MSNEEILEKASESACKQLCAIYEVKSEEELMYEDDEGTLHFKEKYQDDYNRLYDLFEEKIRGNE